MDKNKRKKKPVVLSEETEFKSCGPKCPAATGEPYGSARYCPKLENYRHRSVVCKPGESDVRAVDSDGKHPFYDHPDYTDCCVDFGCCIDRFDGEARDLLSALSSMHRRTNPGFN